MIDQRRLPVDYDPKKFNQTEHQSLSTDRVFRLVDKVSRLTLEKLGMREAPAIGMTKPSAALGLAGIGTKGSTATTKEEKKPEKTVFELKLESFKAASKIKIIKEVRSFIDLGLKEVKDLLEKTPSMIKSGVSKEEGVQIIEKMKALGAKVVLE